MAKQTYGKTSEVVAPEKTFSRIISLLEAQFPEHNFDVNYLQKSFRTKQTDSGALPVEGTLQANGAVKVLICLSDNAAPIQIKALPFWEYISALKEVELLPSVANHNGTQELWLAYTIAPAQLGYIQQSGLQKTLEEIRALVDFFKASTPPAQAPEFSKMIALYDKISYQFVKPFHKTDYILPDFRDAVDPIYHALVSGNPVIIRHPSPLALEYIAAALATEGWKKGFHFGILKHVLPYGLLLESTDKVTGIPAIPLDLLLKDNTGFNLKLCYNACYQTGRPVLFMTTDLKSDCSAFLNVYTFQKPVPVKEVLLNGIHQLSNDLAFERLQKLSEEANEVIRLYYAEYEKEVTAYIPSFCRLLLHLYQTAPHQLKHQLSANLFHHFE